MRKALQWGLSITLALGFLYLAFSGIDIGMLWAVVRRTSLSWAVLLIIVTGITVALRAWRWLLLMRPFAPQVTALDASLALGICYSANFVVPRSGEALRALSLKWRRGVQIAPVLATVVVERILDLVWLVIFVGIALLLLRQRITEAYPDIEPVAMVVLGACVALLVALTLVSAYRHQSLALMDRVLHPGFPRIADVTRRHLDTFLQGLAALHSPRAYLGLIASSVLLNTGYVFIIYTGLISFDFDVSHNLGFDSALVVMAISSIGVIIPTPGGVGSYHYLFREALGLYDIGAVEALACGTVVHAVSNLTYFIIGGPALLAQRSKAQT